MRRLGRNEGFSLMEVIMASVIATVFTGGTMAAFVTAARITRAQGNTGTLEAAGYARETVERFRSMVACDSPWFDAACNPTGIPGPGVWVSDPLPVAAGSESLLASGMKRCYQVTQQDCDEDLVPGDCLAIETRVCWNNDFVNCPC